MMEQSAAPHVDNARRAIAVDRAVFFVLAGALVFGVGVLAALMLFNARALDSRTQEASIDVMREGLSERAGQLDRVVKDYAWWNEAVEAIQLRQDRAWAEARLGSYLYGTHEYDWAFVIAPDGSTFHAAKEGETVADNIATALGNERWRPVVEQSRAAITSDEPQAVHAYIPMRAGRLGIMSATAIVAQHGWTGDRPSGTPYVLVVVRSLSLEWLSELAGALDFGDLSFSLSAEKPYRVAIVGT